LFFVCFFHPVIFPLASLLIIIVAAICYKEFE
jgi:hypothetical protein